MRGGDAATGGDDYVRRRLDPLAVVINAGAGADGAEDAFGGGDDAVCMLDDEFGGEAQIGAALLEEAGGAGVAIDGAIIMQVEVVADEIGIAPVEEIGFDADAIGMAADEAFAGVTFGRGQVGIFVFWRGVRVEVLVGHCGDGQEIGRGGVQVRRERDILIRGIGRRIERGFAAARGVAAAPCVTMGRGFFSGAGFALGAGGEFLFERGCGFCGDGVLGLLGLGVGRGRRDGLDDGGCGGLSLDFAVALSRGD